MKVCPFCNSQIPDEAIVCKFCGSQLDARAAFGAGARPESQVLTLVMGIFGLFCFPFGIVSIILWFGHRGRVKRGLVRSDGSATAGMVLSLVGIGWQMLFIIAAVFIIFSPAFHEAMVAQGLRSLHQAQAKYKAENGEYASAPAQLKKYDGEAGIEIAKWFGYKLEFEAGKDAWSCKAIPKNPDKYRYFYIDQTGTLRHSKTADVGPESPPYKESESFGG